MENIEFLNLSLILANLKLRFELDLNTSIIIKVFKLRYKKKMNAIFKKIPGFISLIHPFPFHFQTIEGDPNLPFDPKLELTLFSKTESGFSEKKIKFRDIKEDYCPLHLVKGNIHFSSSKIKTKHFK